jgi:hypothetical protein
MYWLEPQISWEMFTMAGFNVNRLKMFILDDADPILRLRHETKSCVFQTASIKRSELYFRTVDRQDRYAGWENVVEPFCLK